MERILDLLNNCYASIHELSCVGTPVRFNMPFELGLACALSRIKSTHSFILFEKKGYRLDKTLSDMKGYDPFIHNGSMLRVIQCVLNALAVQGNSPKVTLIHQMSKDLWQVSIQLKNDNRKDTLFDPTLYRQLIASALKLAIERSFIKP